jgi:lipoprotein-anchoring transpeptidase ErfK/SrfK/transposase-like protein
LTARKPLPKVNPQLVADCKASHPNFGQPRVPPSEALAQPLPASPQSSGFSYPNGNPPPAYGGRGQAAPHPGQDNALRPSIPMTPEQRAVISALPPEDQPETGPNKVLPPQFRRTMIDYRTKEPAGTIIIDTTNTYLYLVLGNGKATRYGIGVGREGFTWAGAERVSKMAEWPDWHPPEEMIERQPYLPRFMAGGDGNPLGARALYLGETLYRIHGTNQPSTIGTFVSSGCIRLTNEDITDLYTRVKVGTRVVVLQGGSPATAAAAPVGLPRGDLAVTPSRVPSAPDMPRKRHKPEEIVAKLRQVDVLVSQGQNIADAIRQIGVTEGTYYRWRQEFGGLKGDQVKHPKEPEHEAPKGFAQGEVSGVRDNARQMELKAESTGFEE